MIPDFKNQDKHLLFYRVESLKDDYEELEEKYFQLNHDFREKNRYLEFLIRDFKKLIQDIQLTKFQLNSQKNVLIEEKMLKENHCKETSIELIDEKSLIEGIDNNLIEYINNLNNNKKDNMEIIFNVLDIFKNKFYYLNDLIKKVQNLNGDDLKEKINYLINHKKQLLIHLDKLRTNLVNEKKKSINLNEDISVTMNRVKFNQMNSKNNLNEKLNSKNEFLKLVLSLRDNKENLSKLNVHYQILNKNLNEYANEEKLKEIALDELKNQKRKLTRELREVQNRIEELIFENSHYQIKIEKIKKNKL